MGHHTLPVARTLQHPADIASSRNGQQMSAKSPQHRRKHEIQIALIRWRAAMTRAVLPNPSARAEWLLAGIIGRDLSHWAQAPPLTMTVTPTQEQTPPYLMTMMMTTSPPSPVDNPRHCSIQTFGRAPSRPWGCLLFLMFQGDLELQSVFDDRGVCSEVITDCRALQHAIYGWCALFQLSPSALQLANRRESSRLLCDLIVVFCPPTSHHRVRSSSPGPGPHLV